MTATASNSAGPSVLRTSEINIPFALDWSTWLALEDEIATTVGTRVMRSTDGGDTFPDDVTGDILQAVTLLGSVLDIVIDDGGLNYSAAAVKFSGGGGTGTTATVATEHSSISETTITNPGVDYITAPSVIFYDKAYGEPGSGALGHAEIRKRKTVALLGNANAVLGDQYKLIMVIQTSGGHDFQEDLPIIICDE